MNYKDITKGHYKVIIGCFLLFFMTKYCNITSRAKNTQSDDLDGIEKKIF